MSKEYDNEMRGALFLNDKEGNDKRPDWRGSIQIDGKRYWVSMWNSTSTRGVEYKSLKIAVDDGTKKDPGASPQENKPVTAKPATQGKFDDLEDEIPF